jgi:glucokinase
MLKKFDHVSVERVCSGIGIPNIYGYLHDVERMPEKPEIETLIAAAGDPSVTIIPTRPRFRESEHVVRRNH